MSSSTLFWLVLGLVALARKASSSEVDNIWPKEVKVPLEQAAERASPHVAVVPCKSSPTAKTTLNSWSVHQISTPHWPRNYPIAASGQWTFAVPAYSAVQVTIVSFSVAGNPSTNCSGGDYLSVTANSTSCGLTSSICHKMCGNLAPGTQTLPARNVDYPIIMQFKTNGDSQTSTGFKINLSLVAPCSGGGSSAVPACTCSQMAAGRKK